MEQIKKMIDLKRDIFLIGNIFYLPIILLIISNLYIIFLPYEMDSNYLYLKVKQVYGFCYLPYISFWIFGLFQDLVETEWKENLLSLPYKDFEFCIIRATRLFILFIILFVFDFLIISVCRGINIEFVDFILPIVSTLYISAFSLLLIIVTRSSVYSYLIYSFFVAFQIATRGEFLKGIYPFQWSFPNPHVRVETIIMYSILVSVGMSYVAFRLFKNREFLLKNN